MGWLTNLFSSGISDVVSSVGNAIDSIVTSDEERLALQNKLIEIKLEADLKTKEIMLKEEQERTKRWESDNKSGWLTRNIRPMVLVYLLFLITLMIFTDGNIGQFKINEAYVPLITALATTAFGGYFVMRGIEKVKGKA